MKKLCFISGLAIVSSLFVISCNNEKKETVVVTPEDTVVVTPPADMPADNARITITKEEVPAPAITAFSKKVPAAQNVQYTKVYKMKPGTSDTVVYYYIDYDRNDYSYWMAYDEEGKVVEDNSYTKIDGLPDAVSRSIAEYFPGYQVGEIDKDNDKDIIQYEVQMEKGGVKKKVKFLADGGIYKMKTSS